ncbi:MAG: hypothetical protein JWM20_892 [Patescibacteria group bacterium]|nr:hypothetical protein [Patescibacteria group bacterium]
MADFEEIKKAIEEKRFVPAKPKERPNEKEVEIIKSLDEAKKLRTTKKADGNGYVFVNGNRPAEIELYTLGMNPSGNKYPSIIKDLGSLVFPPQTIICGEIAFEVDGKQRRSEIGRINSSGLKNALRLQESKEIIPELFLFNPLMWNGKDITNWSYDDRFECLAEHLAKKRFDYVKLIELLKCSLADARAMAKEKEWEGLVLADAESMTGFSIKETADEDAPIPRTKGLWKDKEGLLLDFVAYDVRFSTAKSRLGAIKDFKIGIIDPFTKEIIPCGNCGKLRVSDAFAYADPKKLPVAVEVRFEMWSHNGVPLTASVERIREPKDKHYTQCFASEEDMAEILFKNTRKRIPLSSIKPKK